MSLLQELEEVLHRLGYVAVAGVDEVGRGSLAGPVVAAAVIPGSGPPLPGIDDSKRLSPGQRERLAGWIRDSALAWGVAAVSATLIDRLNILEATRRAMSEALGGLSLLPDCALIDAVRLDGLSFPCYSLVRGDSLSYAVAAASILAKVERDRLMAEVDPEYPQYGFAHNKGYGAPGHLQALEEFGPCPLHRLTFRSVLPRVVEA